MSLNETVISIEHLRAALSYDSQTGGMTWNKRDETLPGCQRTLRMWNTRFAGKPALTARCNKGYCIGRVFGVMLKAHRVAWALHHGEWPNGQIDHINGDKADNRAENLRVVTAQGNAKNRPLRSDNSSGHVGVYWVTEAKQWMAQIKVSGKQVTIGRYDTLELAVAARKKAEEVHGYHANHGRRLIS